MNRTNNGAELMSEPNLPAVASLPQDLAIMKLENDNIMALAAARPRNHKKIKADLLEQIDAYPSFAKAVIYCKPVGKDAQGRMQYARGLSIRAAEAIAEVYGFNRIRSEITEIDADRVRVEATFTDYQRGRIWQDSGIVSKSYRSRDGKTVRHSDDRFYNVVVRAEASKRIREVIIRSVPPGLRSELMELAEEKIDALLDDKTVEKIVAQFAGKGITLEMLEAHVGRSSKAGWTKEDRANLLGIWNAIKDGETTIEEAFGKSDDFKAAAKEAATGKVKEKLAKEEPKAAEPTPPSAAARATSPSAEDDDTGLRELADDLSMRIDEAQTVQEMSPIGNELANAREALGEFRYQQVLTKYQAKFKTLEKRKK